MFLYAATILYIPNHVLNEVENLLYDFIWPKGKHHVKKKVLIQDIQHGGLKMPDIKTMVKSIKLTWIKKLITKDNNFTTLAKVIFTESDLNSFLAHKNDVKYLNKLLPPFYKQLLQYWYELYSVEPTTNAEVRKEILWKNKFILVDEKPVFFKHWNNKGIFVLNDILTETGNFKTLNEINEEFDANIRVMEFNSLKSAIPKRWKDLLSNTGIAINDDTNIQVNIGKQKTCIKEIKCRDIYWELINRLQIRPTAANKWEEIYYYVNFDWEHIYSLPYKVARETYLQSLHFQIINRYFPCSSNINKWYEVESPNCKHCGIEDTVEHYFGDCERVRPFWNWFRHWINEVYACNIAFSTLDIIFGIPNLNEITMFDIMNFCILMAKHYICNCKKQEREISEDKFKLVLRDRLLVEKLLLTEDNKEQMYLEKWDKLCNSL